MDRRKWHPTIADLEDCVPGHPHVADEEDFIITHPWKPGDMIPGHPDLDVPVEK